MRLFGFLEKLADRQDSIDIETMHGCRPAQSALARYSLSCSCARAAQSGRWQQKQGTIFAIGSTACAMCCAATHSCRDALMCCRPRCETRQQMTRADQPHMAAAGLEGDHKSFVWCALDAAQFSEVLGATAQQDEQPELILLTDKVRAAVSITCCPAESPQVPDHNPAVLLDALYEWLAWYHTGLRMSGCCAAVTAEAGSSGDQQ